MPVSISAMIWSFAPGDLDGFGASEGRAALAPAQEWLDALWRATHVQNHPEIAPLEAVAVELEATVEYALNLRGKKEGGTTMEASGE